MAGKGEQNPGRASETESLVEAIFVRYSLPQRGSIACFLKERALEEKDGKIRMRTGQDQRRFVLPGHVNALLAKAVWEQTEAVCGRVCILTTLLNKRAQ